MIVFRELLGKYMEMREQDKLEFRNSASRASRYRGTNSSGGRSRLDHPFGKTSQNRVSLQVTDLNKDPNFLNPASLFHSQTLNYKISQNKKDDYEEDSDLNKRSDRGLKSDNFTEHSKFNAESASNSEDEKSIEEEPTIVIKKNSPKKRQTKISFKETKASPKTFKRTVSRSSSENSDDYRNRNKRQFTEYAGGRRKSNNKSKEVTFKTRERKSSNMVLKSEVANNKVSTTGRFESQLTPSKIETSSFATKPANFQSTGYSRKENISSEGIKVSIGNQNSLGVTFDVGIQYDPKYGPQEVILTEEKLEQLKEDIISHIICELKVNRRTVNLLTEDQEIILSKMGK